MNFDVVVIDAVEQMLMDADRRISDRFIMLDYKHDDNEKRIANLPNYFWSVTLPVILGKVPQGRMWGYVHSQIIKANAEVHNIALPRDGPIKH